MDSSLKLLLLSSGITFCFGIGLFQKLRNIKNYKNNSTELSNLISDGLKMFGFRSLSSMLQIILYVTLVLMLFSVVLSKPFYWKQVLCFFLGGLVMAVSLYIIIGIIPKMIPKIIHNSNGYLKKGIHTQFNIITMLGFLLISVIIIGFSLCYY